MNWPAGAALLADATPLIVLAKIGHLDLLTAFAPEVFVPRTVADEVLAGDEADPACRALRTGWGAIVPDVAIPLAFAVLRLDPGEAAVLALALNRPLSVCVLDDGKARAAARLLSVPCVGTLGLIARAQRQGLIPEAKPLFLALQNVGFRADDALYGDILRGLGETWP